MTGVTCIIPTHGRTVFLREALQSVMAQTHPAERVIVVSDDDGSEAASVVAEFPGVEHHVRDGSPGASGSRNWGALLATTGLLAFLDDDDLWKPDYLSEAVALLGPADAVATSFERFGSTASAVTTPRAGMTPATVVEGSPGVTGSTLMIRSAAFNQLGGYDSGLPVMNDTDLFLRFLEAHLSYIVNPNPLVRVRKHDQGQLTNASRRRYDGGWLFINKHRPKYSNDLFKARQRSQYRMLLSVPDATSQERLKAIWGMIRTR